MSTRWVTFDCFGTLVDWNAGFTTILRPIAGDLLPELLEAYHRHEREAEAERPHRQYRDVLATALRRAAAEIGLPLTDDESAILSQDWGSQPVFPDVEPALAGLRQLGYRLGILTNCDDDLFARTQA